MPEVDQLRNPIKHAGGMSLHDNLTFMKNIYLLIVPFAFLCGCGNAGDDKKEKEDESVALASEPSKIVEVTTQRLSLRDFSHEVVSNGKVVGHSRADLAFPASDAVITSVAVKNGSHVKRGQQIATLDDYKQREELRKAENSLDKAELELKDALIGQGFDPEASASVPAEVMKLARLRSGYDEAEAAVASARHSLEQTVLTAPFDGVVANLAGKVFNRPDNSKPFCTVIGNGMDATFQILESELPLLSPGDRIKVAPYSSSEEFAGRVAEINPVVDEKGMVTVTASVESGKGLYDGMNVKVSVLKSLGRQLVVPKSAVVLRSGRQVVFTVGDKKDKAMWNYVHTGLENMGEYTIVDGLEEGMEVIVSGNVNLAHEAPVKIVK